MKLLKNVSRASAVAGKGVSVAESRHLETNEKNIQIKKTYGMYDV